MSDLVINIRVGLYHFQVSRTMRIRLSRNETHVGYRHGFFAVYKFFWIQR
jgi:hypothetical protein